MGVVSTESSTRDATWLVNATSADASGCEEVFAAVAGKSHYIQQVTLSCDADATVTLGAGETGTAVTTVLLGPIGFQADGGAPWSIRFVSPLKVAAATSITVDAGGAGNVCVVIEGYTE